MSQNLTLLASRTLVAAADPPPQLDFVPTTLGPLACSIYLEGYKPGCAVARVSCNEFVGGVHALVLAENDHHCPHCSGNLLKNYDWLDARVEETLLRTPNRNENCTFDQIKFSCKFCLEISPEATPIRLSVQTSIVISLLLILLSEETP